METFGERLTHYRSKAGYSQKEFAEALGITPTRLNYWEKNKREPDFFFIKKIVEILNIEADVLLFGYNRSYVVSNYDKLNSKAQSKVNEYISDLMRNPDNLKSNISDDIAAEIKSAQNLNVTNTNKR
ncbi:MAG: helix-turn-helix transcriptional regulator [Clostridia bacterium]|nr:helix-turn-helix transcriptional regulator [Clostridia bacterium]